MNQTLSDLTIDQLWATYEDHIGGDGSILVCRVLDCPGDDGMRRSWPCRPRLESARELRRRGHEPHRTREAADADSR